MGGGNLPFGFNPQDHEPGRPEDVTGKIPLFAELQKLLSWSGGPVNWDLARQMAISAIAGDYRPVSETETAEVRDAIRLADLWLDAVTDLPSGVRSTEAWSRIEWIEKTLPVWAALCDPVAARVVAAMSSAVPAEQLEAIGPNNPLGAILTQVGGLMFGAQVGQGLAGRSPTPAAVAGARGDVRRRALPVRGLRALVGQHLFNRPAGFALITASALVTTATFWSAKLIEALCQSAFIVEQQSSGTIMK